MLMLPCKRGLQCLERHSLASQTHFCNKREGSGELCIQAISSALYGVV